MRFEILEEEVNISTEVEAPCLPSSDSLSGTRKTVALHHFGDSLNGHKTIKGKLNTLPNTQSQLSPVANSN